MKDDDIVSISYIILIGLITIASVIIYILKDREVLRET